jgi:single-stranded-DNA-specific exonuclease
MDILTKQDIKDILSKRFKEDKFTALSSLPSPHILKDATKGAVRIKEAIEKKQTITLVGDYDVDGVISSFIVYDFFKQIGFDIEIIIPNRFKDGYGLNPSVLETISSDVIITVDNGITALEAANICKEKGIDLIITDHHNPSSTLPDAYAIINPKQGECSFEYEEMCGAQVAWYFLANIKKQMNLEINLMQYLDLLSIAIIADMMKLKCLNRTMAKKGMTYLNNSKRDSIQAIKQRFNKISFTFDDISFLIAPLLNSAGRIDDASVAFEFLASSSFEKAYDNLEYLVSLNEERKGIQQELYELSCRKVDASKNIIVVYEENWHEGVIGIVAAMLTRKYQRPAIVMSIKDGVAKGSARSIGQVDLFGLISQFKDMLLSFGGHTSAAGVSVSVENLEKFKTSIEQASQDIDEELFKAKDDVLGQLHIENIDMELINILEDFEPYGVDNKKPKFVAKDISVQSMKTFGKMDNHLRLTLESKNRLNGIFFNFKNKIDKSKALDLFFTVARNEYNGRVYPQILIEKIQQK